MAYYGPQGCGASARICVRCATGGISQRKVMMMRDADDDDDDGDDRVSLGVGQVTLASDLALRVSLAEHDGRNLWIPRSVLHDDSEVFDDKANAFGRVIVKGWWARERGFAI